MTQIQKLTVKGYKSIQALDDFELRPLNVLIGANGAGKSNFISLFRFLASVVIAQKIGLQSIERQCVFFFASWLAQIRQLSTM